MNYYDVLGVAQTATLDEIKKGYKRMAGKHHPDRPGGDARAMVVVNKAYETLSDPRKREYYDLNGEEAPRQAPIETQALQTIYNIILQLSDQVEDNFDFVEALTFNLKANRHNIAASEAKFRAAIRKAERQRKMIRCKKKDQEANNLLIRVFDQKLALLKEKLEGIPAGVAIADKCLEILADYEYAGEKQARRQDPLKGAGNISGLIDQMIRRDLGG